MKVILLQDVKKLGKKGEIVEVSDGYGRNYLLARKLAAPGTSENINDAKQKKAAADHRAQVASDEAVVLASELKKWSSLFPSASVKAVKSSVPLRARISVMPQKGSMTLIWINVRWKLKSLSRLWVHMTLLFVCIRQLQVLSKSM